LGFPVLARYFTPRDVVGDWSPDALEQTLDFSGVAVSPGDFVIADVDGAIVIPGAIAEAVVAETEEAMQKENLVRKAILEGTSPRDAYQRFGKF
jgi:regulator of RNase E activity RraA